MSLPENHPRLTKRPYSRGELVADGVVHALALVAGIIVITSYSIHYTKLYDHVTNAEAVFDSFCEFDAEGRDVVDANLHDAGGDGA